MKAKFLLFICLIFCAGACSLFGGPSATVKKFIAAAQKGDSATMTKLFSSTAIQKDPHKIKANNDQFAKTSQRAYESDRSYSMKDVTETRNGDTARVSFIYQNQKKSDSIKLVFDLSKENGEWKIDDIGGADKEEIGKVELPTPSPSVETDERTEVSQVPPRLNSSRPGFEAKSVPSELPEDPPPPPPAPQIAARREPISGGVLNGKAVNLPKPPYPPAARAVKASGAVRVEVLVDEKGKVVTAHALSGHPLLRAGAVSAAYGAQFPPTLLVGQPVKVKGVIIYNFVAE